MSQNLKLYLSRNTNHNYRTRLNPYSTSILEALDLEARSQASPIADLEVPNQPLSIEDLDARNQALVMLKGSAMKRSSKEEASKLASIFCSLSRNGVPL